MGKIFIAFITLLTFTFSLTAQEHYYNSLNGTVMCGYQGWFSCPGDGSEIGWHHWGKSSTLFEPGQCTIDLWPDTSEYDKDELYPTPFKYPDGSTAYVFSSKNEKTVARHFSWMQQYNIDGAFLQRFATETFSGSRILKFRDKVLLNCQKGANKHKRGWAVMYDLSGLQEGQTAQIISDWKHLIDDLKITKDPLDKSYIYHNGNPVVSLWGIGFSDKRKYTLEECGTLIDFFHNDNEYGNCTVIIGIPSYWQEGVGDSTNNPVRMEIIKKADIISPWSVGRFSSIHQSELNNYAQRIWQKDIQWCNANDSEYLPVIFPGFSWHNMHDGNSKLDQIPRDSGSFFLRQGRLAMNAGAKMIYIAMFDEVDEATAIFKCTNTPPQGQSKFCTYNDLPSDHYLKLSGQLAGELKQQVSRQH